MEKDNLRQSWFQKYRIVSKQLDKVKQVSSAATAFNTNIDAIFKITGSKLSKLIADNHLSMSDMEKVSQINSPTDIIAGIIKCFSRGIAEEWITDNVAIYEWMEKNFGYDKLQMGGQAGIIANVLALLGVHQVIAHTNSHPRLQAKQFLNLDNLFGINEKNLLQKANTIARLEDVPLVHWIIEFDKGDSFIIDGQKITCPKSNRFIATYDPLNMNLVMNQGFVDYLNSHAIQYLFLSGFHPLQEKSNGVELIKKAALVLKNWQKANPNMVIHLEIASTQDLEIRKAIIDNIVPCACSAGLNERETIDLLNILNKQDLAQEIENNTHSPLLFEALLFLKKTLKLKRIQLHMFGLYITLQDEDFSCTPEQTLNGMMTASVVSSSKALNGELANYDDLTKAIQMPVSDQGLEELFALAQMLKNDNLKTTGIGKVDNYWLCVIPTILVDKPKTLVGMGDTISSVSLLAAQ